MLNSHQNGAISELVAQKKFYELGYPVSVPPSEEAYDIVVDVDGDFLRVQVKSMFKRGDTLSTYRADLRSSAGDTKSYSDNDIDCFALYNSDYDKLYLLWIDEAPDVGVSRELDSWSKHTVKKKMDEYVVQ